MRPGNHGTLVFDLDGTLLDSIADLADAMNASLTEHGHAARTPDECRMFVGEGARRFVERALPAAASDERLMEEILDGFRRHYTTCWAAKTRPYEGIPELLDWLVAHGYRLAVLSNKLELFTVQMVAQLLARWPFANVRGERPGVPRKPDPTGALAIAAELSVEPASCVYLGDTAIDMQTAVAAGMLPVGVLWGFRQAAELLSSGAVHLIAHPTDLIPLLESEKS